MLGWSHCKLKLRGVLCKLDAHHLRFCAWAYARQGLGSAPRAPEVAREGGDRGLAKAAQLQDLRSTSATSLFVPLTA